MIILEHTQSIFCQNFWVLIWGQMPQMNYWLVIACVKNHTGTLGWVILRLRVWVASYVLSRRAIRFSWVNNLTRAHSMDRVFPLSYYSLSSRNQLTWIHFFFSQSAQLLSLFITEGSSTLPFSLQQLYPGAAWNHRVPGQQLAQNANTIAFQK